MHVHPKMRDQLGSLKTVAAALVEQDTDQLYRVSAFND